MSAEHASVRDLLLARAGLVFPESMGTPKAESHVRAFELELADLGYVMSSRLAERLARSDLEELAALRAWALRVLRAHVGADRKHEPLFRSFPEGIPDDTLALWWSKVLVHFLQAEGQPCLFCRRVGTTHVLAPCHHVVCDRCFDGSSYSVCPVCEHHVDRESPFLRSAPERGAPKERVVFKLLDLGEHPQHAAKALFIGLCERRQALSPTDRDALLSILHEYEAEVLNWLPPAIPVRENVAIVFGTLFKHCEPAVVLPHARRFMTTATDVLRFIAVLSGTDGSLLREIVFKTFDVATPPSRFWGRIAKLLGAPQPGPWRRPVYAPLRVSRFKTAKLSRPLRRALLAVLEGLDPDRLVEDMLRHRSYWVWVGEFLHPHEYASRFPNVARAFQVVRKKAPDGTPAPQVHTWYARLEDAVRGGDVPTLLEVLVERPGELARRLDHALRLAGDETARERVLAAFKSKLNAFATPVLLTLRSHLPARAAKAPVRVYWPKGRVSMGVSSPDERAVLQPGMIQSAVRAIDAELLARFGAKPPFSTCVIDESLGTVMVPFNERTASPSAVSLPRGSRIAVAPGKLTRLFLHWCQPEVDGDTTDLDLSVALYDGAWKFVGVCSYYELKTFGRDRAVIAQSSGDLRDGPWPNGATEFVDLHREAALASGVRYAVMVVTAYAGMPFSQLERAFAGVMIRDDPAGWQFDPRTVELKFSLTGEHGVFHPLVLDLQDGVLHWLDVYSRGQLEMNNVETSKRAIAKVCPELMTYFASGVRMSMLDLGLLHAAARCRRVLIRSGQRVSELVRRPGEDVLAFHARLASRGAGEPRMAGWNAHDTPTLALLLRGDLDLPVGSEIYAVFRERVAPSLGASDLIS